MPSATPVVRALSWALLASLGQALPMGDGSDVTPVPGYTPRPLPNWFDKDVMHDGNPLAGFTPTPPGNEMGDGSDVTLVPGYTPRPLPNWFDKDVMHDGNPLAGFTPTPPGLEMTEGASAHFEPKYEVKVELSSEGKMILEGLYQGDIMLSPEQRMELRERRIISLTHYLWPNQTVPYRFGDAKINQSKTTEGIDRWREHTCLNFTKVADDFDGNHLIFVDYPGCYSWVGMQPGSTQGQKVWLANSCVQEVGPTIHEIFHAVGAFHEQSRMDRDAYIDVLYENIEPAFAYAFDKQSYTNNYNVGYDFNSIMHYQTWYFTVNGLPTILPWDPIYLPIVGNRRYFTFRDKLLANTVYKCTDLWLSECNLSENPCKNEGYIGKDCTCVCHPGTAGDQCETLNKEYNEAMLALISPSSETIRTERNVSSEDYPEPDQDGSWFMKHIIAPKCHKVKLVIVDFRLYYHSSCRVDAFNIQMDLNGTGNVCPNKNGTVTQNGVKGCVYCGTQMPLPTTFVSVEDSILIKYFSYNYTSVFHSNFQGFNGIITHEMIPGCDPNSNATTTTSSTTTTPTTTPPTTTTGPPGPPPFTLTNSGDTPLHMAPGNYCQPSAMRNQRPDFQQYGSNFTYYYTSPGYPGYIRPNSTCHDMFYTNEPRYLNVTLERNHLHDGDKLELIHSQMMKIFTRSTMITDFILPTAVGRFLYVTDPNRISYGFAIRAQVINSPCHTVFNITGSDFGTGRNTGIINGPSMGPGIPYRICEYWFVVPEGMRLKVTLVNFTVGSSAGEGDYVLFDKAGDISYMTSPVKFFGDLSSTGPEVVSEGRYMPMLYYGMNQGDGTYNVTISLLNGTTKATKQEATTLIEKALGHE